MKKNQKGFSLLIIILIVAIVSITGYFAYRTFSTKQVSDEPQQTQDQPTPTTPITPTEKSDETATWKTYISPKYNYQFKYPPEAKLNISSEQYVGVSYMGEKQRASGRTQTELADGYAFNVVTATGEGYADLDDFYIQRVNQLTEVCTSIGDPQETTISGKRAITHELNCLGDYDTYYVKNGDLYFEISLLHIGDAEDLPDYTETVNKILSTFEFAQ